MSGCGINTKTGRCVNEGSSEKHLCVRDGKTKRCRKKSKRDTRDMSCPEGTTLNSSTNECVFKFDKDHCIQTTGKMCSLSLNTRIKDKRNLLANLSAYYDTTCNIPYTPEDEAKKCEIFEVPNTKTDFITHKPMKGVGDHYFPLASKYKTGNTIGSDSLWNRIPVSGYNSKYKDGSHETIRKKLDTWLKYVKMRGGRLSYQLLSEHKDLISEFEEKIIEMNETLYYNLCKISPE
jgi:hypothetical protein